MALKPTVRILAPSTDTRIGGVERFANSVQYALSEEWNVEFVTTAAAPPVSVARVGAGYLWESRTAARRLGPVEPGGLVITNGTLGWGAPRDVPRIHVFHGTMPFASRSSRALPLRERVRRSLGGGLAELLSGQHATTVAVSEAAAEEVARLYRITVDRVIENGVDTEVFRPRDRAEARLRLGLPVAEKLALFVGRPESRKGIDIAQAAAATAGYRLVVAGSQPVPGAAYLGLLPPERLSWAYAAADCVLFPTRYEACSYVVLESLAAGVPMVTTPVGWARRLAQDVPGYQRLLTQPAIGPITAALSFCTAHDLTDVVTRARKHVVAQNSLPKFAEQWRELCSETTGGRRPDAVGRRSREAR